MAAELNLEKYCLQIDLSRLATRLGADRGSRCGETAARLWLTSHGFRYLGSHFCNGPAMALLMPGEILSTRQRRSVNGAVFWE
jgi:hypothetical protein